MGEMAVRGQARTKVAFSQNAPKIKWQSPSQSWEVIIRARPSGFHGSPTDQTHIKLKKQYAGFSQHLSRLFIDPVPPSDTFDMTGFFFCLFFFNF